MNIKTIIKDLSIAVAFGVLTAITATFTINALLDHPRLLIVLITGLFAAYLSLKMFQFLKSQKNSKLLQAELETMLDVIIAAEKAKAIAENVKPKAKAKAKTKTPSNEEV